MRTYRILLDSAAHALALAEHLTSEGYFATYLRSDLSRPWCCLATCSSDAMRHALAACGVTP